MALPQRQIIQRRNNQKTAVQRANEIGQTRYGAKNVADLSAYRIPAQPTPQQEAANDPQYDAGRELARRQNRARAAQRTAYGGRKPLTPTVRALFGRSLKKIRKYESTSFLLAYTAAFGAEIFDVIGGALPIIGIPFLVVGGMLHLYLMIFVFVKTTEKSRALLRVGILLLDLMPIVGLLPISVLSIYWLQGYLKKEAQKARITMERIKQKYRI